MNLKKILCGALLVPALFISGCKEDDGDNGDKVEYAEITQTEAVSFLNQMKEEEKFDMKGYEFNLTLAMPNFEGMPESGDEEEDSSEETVWPDISNSDEWVKVEMDGAMLFGDDGIQASYSMKDPVTQEDNEVYIKDNVIYVSTPDGKFKTEISSEDELFESEITQYMPTTEGLLEQIDVVCDSESGLKFEKGEKDGKTYYHIYGVSVLSEGFTIEMPIDIYLTFENNELVSYSYKTFMLFIYMEIEVNMSEETIEFPDNFESYVTNDSFFY